MSRSLGVWARKQEVYLAVAEEGELVDVDPQRIEAPAIMEANERLGGFLTSFRHALKLAPKVAWETAVRLVGDENALPPGVPVLSDRDEALDVAIQAAAAAEAEPRASRHPVENLDRLAVERRLCVSEAKPSPMVTMSGNYIFADPSKLSLRVASNYTNYVSLGVRGGDDYSLEAGVVNEEIVVNADLFDAAGKHVCVVRESFPEGERCNKGTTFAWLDDLRQRRASRRSADLRARLLAPRPGLHPSGRACRGGYERRLCRLPWAISPGPIEWRLRHSRRVIDAPSELPT